MANKWDALPFEIRDMVLEQVPLPRGGSSNIASYASVSREWQSFFERINFHRLVLNQSQVAKFDRVVQRHRKRIVKHIWLRIELSKYDCRFCKKQERKLHADRNNHIFTKAVWEILNALSSWERGGPDGFGDTGPILELSAYSPSDLRHYFLDYHPERNYYPHLTDENCTFEEYETQVSSSNPSPPSVYQKNRNRFHGWKEGVRIEYPNYSAKYRVFGQPLRLDFSRLGENQRAVLSRATAVRGLLIRRQHYRRVQSSALFEILKCLPGLEFVALEPWRKIDYEMYNNAGHHLNALHDNLEPWHMDKQETTEFKQGLPMYLSEARCLKTLSIYESFDSLFHGSSRHRLRENAPGNVPLGTVIADESYSLEHLSVAYAIDAWDFFRDFRREMSPQPSDLARTGVQIELMSRLHSHKGRSYGESPHNQLPTSIRQIILEKAVEEIEGIPEFLYKPTWPNLKTLALTFNMRRPGRLKISYLLRAAAGAAIRMPKLQTMELWGFRLGLAYIFLYRRAGANGHPSIVVRTTCTDYLGIKPWALEAWEEVADKHTGDKLQSEVQILQADHFKTRDSIVEHLELRHLVLHQVSLCQLKWEEENRSRVST